MAAEDFLPVHYRIEALRAASRIVAGSYASDEIYKDDSKAVLDLAEQFVRWLEKGER